MSYWHRVFQNFTAPGRELNEGVSQASKGGSDIIPGVTKVGKAFLSTPAALAAPFTAMGGVAGETAGKTLGAPQAVG
jgi:phosphatidylethanolamine-binding protein (PEBP) family uncharacterized protein